MPKIGIVTVTYNSEPVLDDFFESLSAQSFKDIVLYVIDNNSTDGTVNKCKALIKQFVFNCELIELHQNTGVANGNNIGIKEAMRDGCEYVLLANNDIVIAHDSISNLLNGIERTSSDMAASKIYYYGSDLLWYAGGTFKWPQMATLHYGDGDKDALKYNMEGPTGYAPTCFMLIKTSVFDIVGLMDKRYFVYYDDSDFVYRATYKHNCKLLYVPSSIIYHKVSFCTGSDQSDFSIKYLSRNHIYFGLKNSNFFGRVLFLSYIVLHYFLRDIWKKPIRTRKLMVSSYLEGLRLYYQK